MSVKPVPSTPERRPKTDLPPKVKYVPPTALVPISERISASVTRKLVFEPPRR